MWQLKSPSNIENQGENRIKKGMKSPGVKGYRMSSHNSQIQADTIQHTSKVVFFKCRMVCSINI